MCSHIYINIQGIKQLEVGICIYVYLYIDKNFPLGYKSRKESNPC